METTAGLADARGLLQLSGEIATVALPNSATIRPAIRTGHRYIPTAAKKK